MSERKHYNVGINNPRYGVRLSEETRKKLRELRKDEKHWNWKGDNVGNHALHRWVKKNLPKPTTCQNCHRKDPYDLANITGIYNREFINWKYMCRSCHMKMDYDNGFRDRGYGKYCSEETKQKRILIALNRKRNNRGMFE